MTSRDDTGGGEGGDNLVGMKRKASVVSDGRKDGISADQRNAKSFKVGLGVSLHDIDILAKIAAFLPPGMALMSICVVSGRGGPGHIRQEYLTDNDEYVSHSLRTLIHRFDKAYQFSYDDLREPWPNDQFDKCRDNIRAWMQYNDWKSRCTVSNVERYKHFSSKIARFHEPNFPFNSPSFAAALGLLEVDRYCHQSIGATPTHMKEDKLSLKKTIFDLLDAGASPFEEVSGLFRLYESMTSINTAERFRKTAELYYTTSLPIWDDVVEKMKSTHKRADRLS